MKGMGLSMKFRKRSASVSKRRPFSRKSLSSYLIACLAAIVSCLCCSIPIVISALGFSDIAELPIFKDFGWIFDVTAGLILLTGLFFLWHHHGHDYTNLWDDLEFWLAALFMVVLFGILAIGINTYLANNGLVNIEHDHAIK